MAIAGIPHRLACFTISFTSDIPSISLIFVWQWSSTRLTRLLSDLWLVKSSHFFMPSTEPIVSSPSNLSMVVMPFNLRNVPILTALLVSSKASSLANSFTVMVSVISKIIMVLPLLRRRLSVRIIFPRIVTSPISPSMSLIGTNSSSKSRPYKTSGLSLFLW